MGAHLGIDIGGTFTGVLAEEDGAVVSEPEEEDEADMEMSNIPLPQVNIL